MILGRPAFALALLLAALGSPLALAADAVRCPIVDTGQTTCYDHDSAISHPHPGRRFYGQDAHYQGRAPAYRDNGDGTVTDLNTGLIWQKAVPLTKMSPAEAEAAAKKLTLGGHRDWRVPNIKELYSLIDFRGYTGFSRGRDLTSVPDNAVPYLNTDYFDFRYGNTKAGERYIDAQWLTSTEYVSTTMGGSRTLFGVNFADGRIKGYGYERNGRLGKKFYVRFVRGEAYGQNQFRDNGDGTVSDLATGLTWQQADSGAGLTWEEALAYAEALELAGHDDWRLPNAKELQYLVDYSRSPDTTKSAAIDPVFKCTPIRNEAGQRDFAHYWTSTTHLDGPVPASNAAYVAFGRAMGQLRGQILDVHGAGAQRSDPKTGKADIGHGPQGDARRVLNLVRCVRGGDVRRVAKATREARREYPRKIRVLSSDDVDVGVVRRHEAQPGGEGQEQGRDQQPGGQERGGRQPGGRGNGGGHKPPSFVERLDRNGDGQVSRTEFDGPDDAFDRHDTNRDGQITDAEIRANPPPRR